MGSKAPRPAPTGPKPPASPSPPPPRRDDFGLLGLLKVKGGGTIEDLIERIAEKLKRD